MAFLAYVLRASQGNFKDYLEVFPEACVRLLRDCPPEDVGTRKVGLPTGSRIISSLEAGTACSYQTYPDRGLKIVFHPLYRYPT